MGEAMQTGRRVQLTGLQGRAELNESYGTAVSFDEMAGRWMVRLNGGEVVKVKPANLRAAVEAQQQEEEDDEGLMKVKLGGKEAVVNPKLLKQQFDSISRKYSFATNPALGEEISQFLTDTSAGRSTVTVEQFAHRFKMEPQDAEAYLLYINMMVSFKEQWMDPNAAGL